MADDEEAGEEQPPFDPTYAPTGPRRSTFTPPTGSIEAQQESIFAPKPPPEAKPELDDDALADALSADFSRANTGTVNISADDPAQPDYEPSALTTPAGFAPPADYPSAPVDSASPVDTSWAAPAPWMDLPAPDPSQAVALPDPNDRPVRRSLPDEELVHLVDDPSHHPGGTLDVIEQLESQLALREEEAREFKAWESTMRAIGTPDAIAAVEEARPEFSGVLPVEGAAAIVPPPYSPPSIFAPPVTQGAPELTLAPVPPPAESGEVESGEVDDPFAALFAEPAAPAEEPPQAALFASYIDAPPPGVSNPADAVDDAPPPPPLPAWEVPAPGPNWAPGPDFAVDADQPGAADDQEPHGAAAAFGTALGVAGVASVAAAAAGAPAAALAEEPPVEPWSLASVHDEVPPQAAAPSSWEPAVASVILDESGPEPEHTWIGQLEGSDEQAVAAEPEMPPRLEAPGETEVPPPPALVEPAMYGSPLLPPLAANRPPIVPQDYDSMPPPAAGTAVPAAIVGAPGFDAFVSEPDASQLDSDQEPSHIDPMPVAAGEPVPTNTGTIAVAPNYQPELPDDVDETDRVFAGVVGPVAASTAGVGVAAVAAHPPSGPISTTRIPENETVVVNNEPIRSKVFSLENSGLQPTPVDQRVGRAARLFWLWFASNSSILSLGLGATVVAVGLNLRQSILAILAGVALSFIPLGLTTLAGKRSGQPTMVVSRATFGFVGNIVPAILALVTRLFWGAVLLWLLASSVAIILVGAQFDGGLGDRKLLVISLAIAFLIALLVAFAGYPLFARIQLVLSIISGALIVGLIAFTWHYVDFATALSTPDGSWLLTLSGAVLVFSVVGLVWANSGADLARYQRPGTSGGASMLWATFGTTLPTFILIGYGALLAASDNGIASGFVLAPLDTLRIMLPAWYPIPLLAATGLSLLSGVILTLYSGGFALQAIGVHVRRQWSILIVGVLMGGFALLLTFGVTGGMNELFRDVATTVAVPTAAWAGIFAAETIVRDRRFDSHSLLKRGGVYADVRWGNLIALFVIAVIGYAFTTSTVSWLGWQGYGFSLLGMPLTSNLAASDFGVLVALALGLLFPFAFGIRAIRRQEAAVVQATRVDTVNS